MFPSVLPDHSSSANRKEIYMKQLFSRAGLSGRIVGGVILSLIFLSALPNKAFCQQTTNPAYDYAAKIAADPCAQGRGYDGIYWQLISQGKQPLDAYRATYMYEMGYQLGYYYGFVVQAQRGQPPSDNHSAYYAWLNYYQQSAWSQGLWGWYQQAYLDGQVRGIRVASGQEAAPPGNVVPNPAPGEVGAYQRSLPADDPNDPWSGLRKANQITGPK